MNWAAREAGIPWRERDDRVVAGWQSRGSGPGQGGRAHPDGTSHEPLCPGRWWGGQGPELEGEKEGGGWVPTSLPETTPPPPA